MLFGILIRMLHVHLHGTINHSQDNINNIVTMNQSLIHVKMLIDGRTKSTELVAINSQGEISLTPASLLFSISKPAIDADDFSINILCFRCQQECYQFGNFLRLSQSSLRDPFHCVFLHCRICFVKAFDHWRLGWSRCYGVHPKPVFSILCDHTLR